MFRKSAVLVFVLAALATAQAQQKKRVAVMNFDYATVRSQVASIWGTDQDVGKGITDLLVDKLVADGTYRVIERAALDKILAEQNFSNSDRADANTAAKIARILGVDTIIIGSITQFGRDDKATNVGGGALGGVTGRFGIGGVRKSQSNAVVQITARMIDTSTAEILASASGKGESSRSGTGLLGAGGSGAGAGGGGMDMKSSNFGATILGEATNKAVADLAQQLDAKAGALPTNVVQISGLVADAAPDGTVIINVGSKGGVRVGDKLDIRRKVREVRDPGTGKVIRSIEDSVGSIVITEVDEASAVGKFTGPAPAKVGDTVSSPK
ncbi:MAG: CsgG/HfaB family protein [Bryobacteraceae bacterium]|jgi:curli biogenesis system outer membrane secretion channel CsgG